MGKMRNVDYSVDDMIELTGLPRKKFRDNLIRFCEMYRFSITDFKVDEENDKSDYFFPLEIAEPLALLIRHMDEYPLSRRNADSAKITASAVAKYNASVLDDIDNNLSEYFYKSIYSLKGYLVAREVADWSEPLVRELTHFLINLSTLSFEDVGAAICDFTKKLNDMNYYLHRGSYTMGRVQRENVERAMREMDLPDDSDVDKELQKQNVSLDSMIANIICWQLEGTKKIRDVGFPSIKEIVEKENERRLFLSEKIAFYDEEDNEIPLDKIAELPVEEQRSLYIDLVLGRTINVTQFKLNQNAVRVKKKQKAEWKPIDKKIEEGIFEGSTLTSEYKRHLQTEIEKHQKQLEYLQQELQVVDERGTVPFSFENDDLLKRRQEDFVEHCKDLDTNYARLNGIVDTFVGQALNEFLK